ncbi:MAG: hypothetical protein ACFE0J_02570 [Elainellaceae cyanobacterium]
MNYQEQLNPWVVHQLLPNLTQQTLARFRRRNEADAYLRVMKQMRPHLRFTVAFEVQPSSGRNVPAEG